MDARSGSKVFATLVASVCLLFAACGRSDLNDLVPRPSDGGTIDGSADGDAAPGKCSPSTCPNGCCDGAGRCVSGDQSAACGAFGESCNDCPSLGFDSCDATRKTCVAQQDDCGPNNCKGCCDGDLCLLGTGQNSCGAGGETCAECRDQGLTCQGQQCVKQACDSTNCKGCCFGDQCLNGVSPTACGAGGNACENCIASGGNCVSTGTVGGKCQSIPPCGPGNCTGCCSNGTCVTGGDNGACGRGGVACKDCKGAGMVCSAAGTCVGSTRCNPNNCPGCCVGDVCAIGSQDNACGTGGAQCRDCGTSAQVCTNQQCVTPPPRCTPQNCAGCCDGAGECRGGFLNQQCGQFGAACIDCSAQRATCNTAASPRVCTNPQTQCPDAYPGCPNGTSTAPPTTTRNACTANDLANARAACTNGPQSVSCTAFINFLQSVRPACFTCLSPFFVAFQELSGLYACVAPFVSQACNRSTGCAIDCQAESCDECPAGGEPRCRTQVRTSQCASFFLQTQCVLTSFGGAGAFCNPNNYPGYGGWLQGVGNHYCGAP